MEDFEFIIKYPSLIEKLKLLVNEKYYPVIETMEERDPRDLISGEKYIPNETSALFLYF